MRHRSVDYKLVEAYHRATGATDPNYWRNVQKRAASQGKPLDVVFEHYERPGEWVRVHELMDVSLQQRVKAAAQS